MTGFDSDHFYTSKPYGFVEFTMPEEMAEALTLELKPRFQAHKWLDALEAKEWGELEPGAITLLPQADGEEAIAPSIEPAYFVKEDVTPADVIAMVSKAATPNSDTTL